MTVCIHDPWAPVQIPSHRSLAYTTSTEAIFASSEQCHAYPSYRDVGDAHLHLECGSERTHAVHFNEGARCDQRRHLLVERTRNIMRSKSAAQKARRAFEHTPCSINAYFSLCRAHLLREHITSSSKAEDLALSLHNFDRTQSQSKVRGWLSSPLHTESRHGCWINARIRPCERGGFDLLRNRSKPSAVTAPGIMMAVMNRTGPRRHSTTARRSDRRPIVTV